MYTSPDFSCKYRSLLFLSVLNYTANGERKHGEESLAKVKKEAYMQVQEIEEFGNEIAKNLNNVGRGLWFRQSSQCFLAYLSCF